MREFKAKVLERRFEQTLSLTAVSLANLVARKSYKSYIEEEIRIRTSTINTISLSILS